MGVSVQTLKGLVLIIVFSYFTYALYWFVSSSLWTARIIASQNYLLSHRPIRFAWNSYAIFAVYSMEFSAFFGSTIRLVGASLALISAYTIWRSKPGFFQKVKGKVSQTLVLEGVYFLSFVPSIVFALGFIDIPYVNRLGIAIAYSVKIALTFPFLITLSLMMKNRKFNVNEQLAIRLSVFSGFAYVVALWMGHTTEWAEIVVTNGIQYVLRPPQCIPFISLICTFPLSVALAMAGTVPMFRKVHPQIGLRWWGLSLILMALHFMLYSVYSLSFLGLDFFLLYASRDEIWVIAALGLGIYLATRKDGLAFSAME